MNKRILLYVGFLLYILTNVILAALSITDYNTLILSITIIACFAALLPLIYRIIDDYAESKRVRKVKIVESRQYDKGLLVELEDIINQLSKDKCVIDSIQILSASDWNDGRKEIVIIYH